ncbi:MAG: NOL1/NOP2/sun family putative RNA methylase [Candidatus Heimdallarchaeota archaeon]|nr:NOL1/NOP2/sun family putative RNA methylase [Candidatus Heimdallarchaeota archaeon]
MNDSFTPTAIKLAKDYGYLPYIIERFIKLFGLKETEEMLEAFEVLPQSSIRVNTLKITSQELIKRLLAKGFELKTIDWFSDGLIIEHAPFSLGSTTEHLSGFFFIQSIASWLPVLTLNPQPNELVVDLAAAPGGKATHIAQKLNNTGTLICVDISRERIKSLRSNLARCGVINALCLRTDGRKISNYELKADRILLDSPCTGEGLMALDRSRRMSKTLKDILRMTKLQKQLLTSSIKILKKGGVLVYSTCSLAPEENEFIINWALNEFPLEIVETKFSSFGKGLTSPFNRNIDPSLKRAVRLYPHKHNTEGFFFCKLKLLEDCT